MKSYRLARRSFLQGIGAGAVGLRTMLRTLEATAQGAAPPPRFLMTHWPVGTVKYLFLPTGSGTSFTFSPILKPFETAGLKNDTIILYGLQTTGINNGMGGGHEAGTPKSSTGANCPGTRQNGGEADDAAAGGPSWDQVFLKNVPELKPAGGGAGYANAICDARVDSLETSTQCLSYDYATRSIASARPAGMITENIPLLPELSPLQLYNKLFVGFMPGGGGTAGQMATLLKARKSVLDYSMAQLARMKTLCPASEASKIDVHTDAIRKIETQLTTQINMGTMTPNMCTLPPVPDSALKGKTGSKFDYSTVPTKATTADDTIHEQIGKTHMAILRTAFQCDLIRVGTFQWSPGTNHVSFQNQFPNQPTGNIYMHHPTSHVITNRDYVMGSLPPAGQMQDIVHFLANVQTWYNQKMADILVEWKNTTDVFGGNLLANTIIPYITEVAETTHSWSPMPALIFGGSRLGMKGGQFQNFETRVRSYNDMWISIAQAYFKNANPLASLPTSEKFMRTGVTPIAGLWAPPTAV